MKLTYWLTNRITKYGVCPPKILVKRLTKRTMTNLLKLLSQSESAWNSVDFKLVLNMISLWWFLFVIHDLKSFYIIRQVISSTIVAISWHHFVRTKHCQCMKFWHRSDNFKLKFMDNFLEIAQWTLPHWHLLAPEHLVTFGPEVYNL